MPRILHVSAAVVALAGLVAVTACDDKPDSKASASVSKSASESPSEAKSSKSQPPAPDSTEAGIAAFQKYLRALGSGDAEGACEMAVKFFKDEAECEMAYGFMFGQMPKDEAKALSTVTIDESKVEELGPGELRVPSSALEVDVTFDEPFDHELYFEDGAWYVRDPASAS